MGMLAAFSFLRTIINFEMMVLSDGWINLSDPKIIWEWINVCLNP
jgi:hypothetical protein